jgi:hypothetical protein
MVHEPWFSYASEDTAPLFLIRIHSLHAKVERGRDTVVAEWTAGGMIPAVTAMRLDNQRAANVVVAGRFQG